MLVKDASEELIPLPLALYVKQPKKWHHFYDWCLYPGDDAGEPANYTLYYCDAIKDWPVQVYPFAPVHWALGVCNQLQGAPT